MPSKGNGNGGGNGNNKPAPPAPSTDYSSLSSSSSSASSSSASPSSSSAEVAVASSVPVVMNSEAKVPNMQEEIMPEFIADTSLAALINTAIGLAVQNGGVSVAGVIADCDHYIQNAPSSAHVVGMMSAAIGAVGGVRSTWAPTNNALLQALGEVGGSFVGVNGGNYKGFGYLGYILMHGLGLRMNAGQEIPNENIRLVIQNFKNKFNVLDIRKWSPGIPKDEWSEKEEILSDAKAHFLTTSEVELDKAATRYAAAFIAGTIHAEAWAVAGKTATIGEYKEPTEEEKKAAKKARKRRTNRRS